MASHLEPLDLALLGAAQQQSGDLQASRPLLSSALRIKTDAQITAPNKRIGHSDDHATTDNGAIVTSSPFQTSNDHATDRRANDTNIAGSDIKGHKYSTGAALPSTAAAANAGPSIPHLLLPLMPAMVGPNEICPPEVWSKDPNLMMYCYKIIPCTHRTPHDWRVCPWAHPNERAARRCPRTRVYASVPCANARSGRPCPKGTACEISHNVTEYWLHPSRYRVEWCSLGMRCNRRLCFFAHSEAELRSAVASSAAAPATPLFFAQQQRQDLPQAPFLDLLAHSAATASAGGVQAQMRAAEQHLHQQQQQQQQQASFVASRLNASATSDGARQHDLSRLLMTAGTPHAAFIANNPQPFLVPVADAPLMRHQQQMQQQHQLQHQQQHQRQSSISSVPAFSDLLGSVVAPHEPVAAMQPAPALTAPAYAPTATPSKYMLDASSAELIAAILRNLPNV